MSRRHVLSVSFPSTGIVCDEYDRNRATIELSGEIDIACVPALRAELDRQARAGRRLVRVDTYDVTFMNTPALNVLVDAHHRWLAMRGTLVLIGVQGPVLRLLRLTGADAELLYMPPAAIRALPRELLSVS